jgi:hypothetical protein
MPIPRKGLTTDPSAGQKKSTSKGPTDLKSKEKPPLPGTPRPLPKPKEPPRET